MPRGAVGYTFLGTNVYGPFEAGFNVGVACVNKSSTAGDCLDGVDVPTCLYELQYECEGNEVDIDMFDDECGGHALPYHLHVSSTNDIEMNFLDINFFQK